MSQKKATSQSEATLKKEREQLLEELSQLRRFMQAEVDIDPDEGDAEIFEREKNAALIVVLERKLKGIDAALRSMERGQYGTCERCSKPIEPARLEVKPDATMCLKCQEEVERMSKRGRRTMRTI